MSGFDLGGSYLTFNISDLEGIAREILSPAVLAKAMSSALDEIEVQLKMNFQARQGQWKPLALSTQHQRMRQGYGPQSPILVRSGTLMDNAASGREVEISGDEIRGDVFPNDDAQAPYSKEPLGDYMETLNKAREFYSLDDEQMAKVYQVFEDALVDAMGLE
jgi:hypothetical protein